MCWVGELGGLGGLVCCVFVLVFVFVFVFVLWGEGDHLGRMEGSSGIHCQQRRSMRGTDEVTRARRMRVTQQKGARRVRKDAGDVGSQSHSVLYMWI